MTFQVWEASDSMTGSLTKELGQAEVVENKMRLVAGQITSVFDLLNGIQPYCPVYIPYPGAWWIRKRLEWANLGNGYFDITATYSLMSNQGGSGGGLEGGGEGEGQYYPGSVSFDTTGQTRHITQALSQEAFPPDAADFQGAIGVSGDSVNGVDVVSPGMRYSETWVVPVYSVMDPAYIKDLYELTGTVNNSTFRCFDEGEALFIGARGQWTDDSPFATLTFEFEARANDYEWYPYQGYTEDAGTLEGWEHVWIRYEDATDANTLIKRPVAAYKSRVYKKKSWEPLGISQGGIATPKVPQNATPGQAGGPGLGG